MVSCLGFDGLDTKKRCVRSFSQVDTHPDRSLISGFYKGSELRLMLRLDIPHLSSIVACQRVNAHPRVKVVCCVSTRSIRRDSVLLKEVVATCVHKGVAGAPAFSRLSEPPLTSCGRYVFHPVFCSLSGAIDPRPLTTLKCMHFALSTDCVLQSDVHTQNFARTRT